MDPPRSVRYHFPGYMWMVRAGSTEPDPLSFYIYRTRKYLKMKEIIIKNKFEIGQTLKFILKFKLRRIRIRRFRIKTEPDPCQSVRGSRNTALNTPPPFPQPPWCLGTYFEQFIAVSYSGIVNLTLSLRMKCTIVGRPHSTHSCVDIYIYLLYNL